MWSMTFRDLRYRRRRFVIAIAGTALVFAMALVMAGMSASFRLEADRLLGALGADAWIVPDGVVGPFTSVSAFPGDVADEARSGSSSAEPLVVLRQTVTRDGSPKDVNVLGVRWAGLPKPLLVEGRGAREGEAVADTSLGADIGESIPIGGREFTVVGLVDGLTFLGGIPVVFVTVPDAQGIGFGGQRLVSSVMVRGSLAHAPAEHAILTNAAARADLLRPLEKGVQAIDSVQILLWIVAAIIVAAVIYLSALERLRDFAVLKAVGASTTRLFGSLALQAVIISLVSAAIAFGISLGLAPTFALPIEIPVKAFALLPAVALFVGIAASLSGLKRAIDVDPARAFGGA